MLKKSLVSVITIFLNAEKYIQEAIESVIAQSYDHWELLLVDDGSIDGSTAIAKSFTQQHPDKIFYLEHEGHQNRGMSATRNLGIQHAKGDYIALLDADDLWEHQKLAEQVSLLDAHPEVSMIYGRTLFWFSWTADQPDMEDYQSGSWIKSTMIVPPPKMLTRFFKSCPYPCSILVRRNVVLELGGFEEAFRGMYEDQIFFAKIFTSQTVLISDRCWDKYRQHSESCCAQAISSGQFHPENPSPATYTFLTWLKSYLIQQQVWNLWVWWVLQNMLLPYEHPTLYKFLKPFTRTITELKSQLKKTLKGTQGKMMDRNPDAVAEKS